MTGPKDIVIAVLVGLTIVIGLTAAFQKQKISGLKSDVQMYQAREKLYEGEVEKWKKVIADLQAAIIEQNDSITTARELGIQAQEAQNRADAYADRLAIAEGRLLELIEAQERFDEFAAGADQCQMYELVLRSIAGEVP